VKSAYLIICAILLSFAPSGFAQYDAHGWEFNGGYAAQFDRANIYADLQPAGQYFQTAGGAFWNGGYEFTAQWIKQFYPRSAPHPAPDSLKVTVKLLNPEPFSKVFVSIAYEGDHAALFPPYCVMNLDTSWQTISIPTYHMVEEVIYVSLVFSPCLQDSGYIMFKMLAKNLAMVYGDSAIVIDSMTGAVTGLAPGREPLAPSSSELMQNYPNPFNPSTTVPYALREAGDVDLRVFDLLGREVAVLERGHVPAGTHHASFDGSHLPSGAYCAVLKVDGRPAGVRKLLLVK
jgi:hypothetical protein